MPQIIMLSEINPDFALGSPGVKANSMSMAMFSSTPFPFAVQNWPFHFPLCMCQQVSRLPGHYRRDEGGYR